MVVKYYFAGAQRIAMRKSGTVSYLLSDHLGSTSITTNASGNVIAELRYKSWGETRYSSGSTPTNYKYTGQREEAGFGLYFYNARWYDSLTGRFAQADTIVTAGVQGLDRYAYANNSPIRYTDPTGHKPACEEGDDCDQILSSWRLSGAQYWKALIKDHFGITMSDEGDKNWTESNLSLMYSSLSNINTALNRKLKSLASGWAFMMREQDSTQGAFHGLTHTDGSKIINFFTIGDAAIRQMNIYHEFGHLLDNRPGMEDEFTNAVPNDASWVSGDKINPNALLDPNSVYDPNYGQAQAIQGILTVGPPDQWADAFANYVAGNIKPTGPGAAMYTFVQGALAPYIGAP